MKTINYSTIERYAKRIEKENIKNKGTSLSWNTMVNDAPIICVHNGTNKVDVEENWKTFLEKHKYEVEGKKI